MLMKQATFTRIKNVVEVPALPECDFCRATHDQDKLKLDIPKAHYDMKTKFGHWAYACKIHYENYGTGLGTGRGQMLVLAEKKQIKEKDNES